MHVGLAERTEIWDYEEGEWIALAGGKSNFNKREEDKIILEGKDLLEPIDNYNDIVMYQKQWITHHADRWWGRMNKLKNILALNTMASQMGIPVINLDSFGAVQEYTFPDTVYRPLRQTEFCNWAVERGFNNTKAGHYFAPAHKSFANFIAKKVDPTYHADNISKQTAE